MSLFLISVDAEGLRAGQLCGGVEHAHWNCNFGRLGIGMACTHARTRERLEPIRRVLGQRTTVVPASLLPFVSTASCDGVDNFFALSCAGCGRRPVNCTFVRRNRGHCVARDDLSAAGLRVVCAVAADGIDRRVRQDLIKQFVRRFTFRDIPVRHECRSQSTRVRVECEMDFPPPCGTSSIRAGGPSACLRRRPSRSCCPRRNAAVHRYVYQAASRAAFAHGRTRSCSSARASRRSPDLSDFAQSLARRERECCLQAERPLDQCIALQQRTVACGHGVRHVRKIIIVIRIRILLRLIWPSLSVVKFPTRYFAFGSCVAPLSSRVFPRAKIENLNTNYYRRIARRRGAQTSCR